MCAIKVTARIDLLHIYGVHAHESCRFDDGCLFRVPWDRVPVEFHPFAPILTAREPSFSKPTPFTHRRPPECPRPRRGPGGFDNGLGSRRKTLSIAPRILGPKLIPFNSTILSISSFLCQLYSTFFFVHEVFPKFFITHAAQSLFK